MVTGVAFFILGIIFLFVALYTLLVKIPKSRKQVERREGHTKGRITKVHVHTYRRQSSNLKTHETKTYKADFVYTVGGQEYTLNGIVATNVPTEGEEMDISYNPDKPSDAHVDKYFADPTANKTGGLILLVIAAVLLLIGIVAIMMALG